MKKNCGNFKITNMMALYKSHCDRKQIKAMYKNIQVRKYHLFRVVLNRITKKSSLLTN